MWMICNLTEIIVAPILNSQKYIKINFEKKINKQDEKKK